MKKSLRSILFPIAVFGSVFISIASEMVSSPFGPMPAQGECNASPDTVVYPVASYKDRRVGDFEAVTIADSLLGGPDSLLFDEAVDTLPHLTARDTIKAPDSLKFTDPFRYKYYVALVDSLTHKEVCDSLKHEGDSLMSSFNAAKDTIAFPDSSFTASDSLKFKADSLSMYADSTHAEFDFSECHKIDSVYYSDSTARAKAAFEAWYNSLSKEARKKYDYEQKEKRKREIRDSLDQVNEEKKARRDSIIDGTPRVLDTYAVSEDDHYKKIIAWTVDHDFQDLQTFVPDTGYNYRFYDYKFQREDVNATWLGVAGSPVQTYNFFNRTSTGVSFMDPLESWTANKNTMLQYNTKTPYTELAYWGTLLAGSQKESNNIHILTTQNITPALNFSILYDAWGGNGMLVNEKVKNKTFAAGLNHLGKRYVMNAGIINNKVEAGENGGIKDISEIRDTTIDSREVRVNMEYAASTTKKTTFYLDNQLSIPFNFINDIKVRRDSTFVPDSTAEVPTAYIGQSFEYSRYQRLFDNQGDRDSLGQRRLDNKVYIRLQPFGSEAAISKIDVGLGDYAQSYHNVTATDTSRFKENSMYLYAGANGQLGENFHWNAKAHEVFAGADAGNTNISGRLEFDFFPFRKDTLSPVRIAASASSSLLNPSFYERHMYSTVNELLRWDLDSPKKVSTTKFEGSINIPYWKMEAKAGYALLANNIWYDSNGVANQNTGSVISIASAYLRKELVLAGDLVHLDTKVLAQYSSNQAIVPLPAVSLNLKYFLQFPVQPGVLDMQLGVNGWWNSKWYSPEWNFITGTFHNQTEWQYNNGPFFDVFMNLQWKNVCVFIKMQNLGKGWPMDHSDYFSAHRHIVTQGGSPGLKLGIWWPFALSTTENKKVSTK